MWLGRGAGGAEETKRRLREATEFIAETSFRSHSTSIGDWRMSVWSDPKRKQHEAIVAKGEDTLEARVIGDRLYLRLSAQIRLPTAGLGWHELDRSRLPVGYTFSFGPPGKREPANSEGLIGAILSGRIRRRQALGTVDMIKVGSLGGFTPRLVTRPRSGLLQAPFRAILDTDGRLASFHIGQTAQSPPVTVLYGDFDVHVEVMPPDAAVVAPENLYEAMEATRRRRAESTGQLE